MFELQVSYNRSLILKLVDAIFPNFFPYDTNSVATYGDYIIIGFDYSYSFDVNDKYLMGVIVKRNNNNTNWIVKKLRSDTPLYIYNNDNLNSGTILGVQSADIYENRACIAAQIEAGEFQVYMFELNDDEEWILTNKLIPNKDCDDKNEHVFGYSILSVHHLNLQVVVVVHIYMTCHHILTMTQKLLSQVTLIILMVLMAMRMIRLTVEHGFSPMSTYLDRFLFVLAFSAMYFSYSTIAFLRLFFFSNSQVVTVLPFSRLCSWRCQKMIHTRHTTLQSYQLVSKMNSPKRNF